MASNKIQRRRHFPCGQWQLPRDVRLHGVWLLRHRHRQDLLPRRQPVRLPDAVPRHLWRRLPDAAVGCGVPGRLHRSPRPPPGPDHYPRPDGHGHPADRLRSRLCHAGRGGAVAGAVRPAPAGFFRRRRAGRGFGLPVGDRHARTQRLLRQLAVGQPAGRGGLRRPARRAPQPVAEPAGHGRMGLARAVLHRLPDRSGAVRHPSLAGGNAGVRGAHPPTVAVAGAALHRAELRRSAGRYRDGGDDHRIVLPDHRLHADLRQERNCNCRTSTACW